jgi:hypothetical protein
MTRRDNNNNSKSSDPNGLRRCVTRVLPPWQQPYTETTTRKEEWRGGLCLWILDCNSSLRIESQRDFANSEEQEKDKKWNLTATKSPQKLEWLILHICSNINPSETSNVLTARSSERNTPEHHQEEDQTLKDFEDERPPHLAETSNPTTERKHPWNGHGRNTWEKNRPTAHKSQHLWEPGSRKKGKRASMVREEKRVKQTWWKAGSPKKRWWSCSFSLFLLPLSR